MATALHIVSLVLTGLPTLIKVLQAIQLAAANYHSSQDKEKWVMGTLTTQLPKLSSDDIYNWLKVGLYAARLVGVKI